MALNLTINIINTCKRLIIYRFRNTPFVNFWIDSKILSIDIAFFKIYISGKLHPVKKSEIQGLMTIRINARSVYSDSCYMQNTHPTNFIDV